MFIFGGDGNNSRCNDLYEFDTGAGVTLRAELTMDEIETSAWRKLKPTGDLVPRARSYAGLAAHGYSLETRPHMVPTGARSLSLAAQTSAARWMIFIVLVLTPTPGRR